MRAAPYARYSTDRQDEASIADQLRVDGAYIARQGWSLAGEYVDEGLSGDALGNRPGVQRLLADAYAGRLDVIVVMELWRLARSEDLPPLIRRLKFRGVRVIGVQDGFDSNSPHARMQAGMKAIMGGEFIDMVRARTHSALEMRAKAGRSAGGRAYGYTSQFEPVETEAAIVREIFERYARGEPRIRIASDLNARGVPSPGSTWKRTARRRDGRWLVSGLRAILANELYTGRRVWNRSEWVKDPDTGKRTRRARPESEWVVQNVRPLIDVPTWQKVQARFRPGGGRGQMPTYLLSGLLRCALCGAAYIVIGGRQRRYVCGSRHHGGPAACSAAASVPRVCAEVAVLEHVQGELLSPAAEELGVRTMRQAEREAIDEEGARPAELVEVERDLSELERAVRAGTISRETAAPAIEAARWRRRRLHVAYERRVAGVGGGSGDADVAAWRAAVASMREILKGADVAGARAALRELVGEIRLSPAEPGFVRAQPAHRPAMLLATGTSGRGIRDGSGGRIRSRIPAQPNPDAAPVPVAGPHFYIRTSTRVPPEPPGRETLLQCVG